MDPRWRNLAALLVIVAAAAAAYNYLYVPPQQLPGGVSFDSGCEQIKDIWTGVGLSESYMSLDDLEFVDLMTAGQVASLEARLADYEAEITGKNPALESLTGIYLDSAVLLAEYQSMSASLDAMQPIEGSELCTQLSKINSDKDKVIDYIDHSIELSGKIADFKQKYPSESSKANLTASAFDESGLNQAKVDVQQNVADIAEFCGAET